MFDRHVFYLSIHTTHIEIRLYNHQTLKMRNVWEKQKYLQLMILIIKKENKLTNKKPTFSVSKHNVLPSLKNKNLSIKNNKIVNL